MLKKMFSNPYYWIVMGISVGFGETLVIANIPISIALPLVFVVSALGGFLSARLKNHEQD